MLNAGFEHDQLVEFYGPACEVLRMNAEKTPSLWKREGVREMDVRDWLKEKETLAFSGVDLVAGGPPCQPFSIGAGERADHADSRNMFPAAASAIDLLQPKLFVFENVPGLLRESFLPYYNYTVDRLKRPSIRPKDGEEWVDHHERIKRARRPIEYHVHREIIDAADLGVPQTRKRVFLIGIRADISGSDEWKPLEFTHSRAALLHAQWITGSYWEKRNLLKPDMPLRLTNQIKELRRKGDVPTGAPWRTTRDAIAGLPEPIDREPAKGFLNHVGIPGARTYRGHTGGWIDWPAKTIKAGVHGVCGGEAMIRFLDGEVRYLTVREAARVQSFPDTYELPEKRSVAMRVVGNAVAVTVAETIGHRLAALLTRASLGTESDGLAGG
ncbi:DNA cytosine methyltransferase [Micromonospora sp. NPDC047730]|uniref:DNA cytosine methyltransferase n=1 Tax=Micromonospora sp. NPDC047730 TaxID=3364253 RepID=UPI0037170350